MILTERQNNILKTLKANRTANVKWLAKTLYVSEATIRRDLKEMQSLGLLERSHGGAILPENSAEISMFVRMQKNAKQKEKIATSALAHIPSFRSLFIDSSSTALALAERMELGFKTVVTNSLQTALVLSKKENINLILLGGNVQSNTNSTTGSWTSSQLNDFSFDLMLCSCAAIKGEEVFERSLDQKEIKRIAFSRSVKRILLADSSKFNADGFYRFSSLPDFDFVFSD